jgi:excisionase family DNA binding protein
MTAKEHKMSNTADRPLESTILTIDQAAAYLAIPKATLYTWRTRRAGFGPPAIKLGGCLRYRRSDLDAWIAQHVETFDGPEDGAESTPVPVPSPRDGVSLSRTSNPRDHRF